MTATTIIVSIGSVIFLLLVGVVLAWIVRKVRAIPEPPPPAKPVNGDLLAQLQQQGTRIDALSQGVEKEIATLRADQARRVRAVDEETAIQARRLQNPGGPHA